MEEILLAIPGKIHYCPSLEKKPSDAHDHITEVLPECALSWASDAINRPLWNLQSYDENINPGQEARVAQVPSFQKTETVLI